MERGKVILRKKFKASQVQLLSNHQWPLPLLFGFPTIPEKENETCNQPHGQKGNLTILNVIFQVHRNEYQ